jgi:hypothetical protein
MRNHIGRLAALCAAGALLVAPGAAMAKAAPKYPVPKPTGKGPTKNATKAAATGLQKTSVKSLAAKGLKVNVSFSAAGTITITVKNGKTTIGTGTAKSKKAGKGTITVKFNAAGQKFLKTGAGKKVSVTTVFKPSAKGGKSSTSTATVKVG